MRSLLSVFLFLSLSIHVLAQSDPIIEVRGAILDGTSNEPVQAEIFYELMPYGDEVGHLSITNDSATYDMYLKGNQDYKIRVEAEGYFPLVETYTVPTGEELIQKNILIKPGGVGFVQRLDNLVFAQGSAEIEERSHSELDELADILAASPAMVVQLEGHTDPQGSASGNMRLSQQRVDAVRAYLVNKGIDEVRVKTKAFGGTQPLSRESTPEARAANRRVEVRILSL